MGDFRMSDTDWSSYRDSSRSKTQDQVFTRRKINRTNDARTSFDPTTIKVRESRDSKSNPLSTPIILGFDVTGSMGEIPFHFVKNSVGPLMKEIYSRKPVSDPHVMCMAIGDANGDSAPLQVTQFEADIKIAKQIEDLYIEKGGWGNGGESYTLAWYFAAHKTACDNYEKRGQKGILITMGDEPTHDILKSAQIEAFIGDTGVGDKSAKQLLAEVRQQYDVFHIILEEGDGLSKYGHDHVIKGWENLIGKENVIRLSDHTKLAEVVVSALQKLAGEDLDAIASSWDVETGAVVKKAIKNLPEVAKRPAPGASKLFDPKPKVA